MAGAFPEGRRVENALLLAGLLAPRVNLQYKSGYQLQPGEGQQLRQGLMGMAQLMATGRQEQQEKAAFEKIASQFGLDPNAMASIAQLPSNVQPYAMQLAASGPALKRQQEMLAELQRGGPSPATAAAGNLVPFADAFGLSQPAPSSTPTGAAPTSGTDFGQLERAIEVAMRYGLFDEAAKAATATKALREAREGTPPVMLAKPERGGILFHKGQREEIAPAASGQELAADVDRLDRQMLETYRQLSGGLASTGAGIAAIIRGSEGDEAKQLRLRIRQLAVERQAASDRYQEFNRRPPIRFPAYTFGNAELQREIMKDALARFGIAPSPEGVHKTQIPKEIQADFMRYVYEINQALSAP